MILTLMVPTGSGIGGWNTQYSKRQVHLYKLSAPRSLSPRSTHQYTISEQMSCERLLLASSAPSMTRIAVDSHVSKLQTISHTVQMTVCHYHSFIDYVLTIYLARAAFVCETEVDERPITGPASAQSDHCPLCRPAIPWDISKVHKILEHVAAHILFDNTLDATQEPCGLCMRPSPLCSFYLRKGKGAGGTPQIDERMSRCPNLISKLFYSAAATERTHSPCTNVPVTCPLCPSTSPAVWKYNMKKHLAHIHPSTKGRDFPEAYVIGNSEKAALKILWEKRFTVPHRRRQHNATSNSLPISELHSSRQAIP